MKRVLITGAGSYIGTKVYEWLAKYPDQYVVSILDMLDGNWRSYSFEGYDTVYHVAGIAHKTNITDEQYEKVNHLLAVEVASLAKICGVKQFIFMSSGAVYSQNDKNHRRIVVDEESKLEPSTMYGLSKKRAEDDLLKMEGINIAILRPPMVYGPGAKGNYNSLRRVALKTPVFPYVDNHRSMIFIDNLCEFIRLLIDSQEQGVFLPQNKELINTSLLVQEIAKNNGKKVILIKGCDSFIRYAGRLVNKVNKAFGDFYYVKEIDYFDGKYQVADFSESIFLTEH